MFDDEMASLEQTAETDALAEQLRAEQDYNLILQESLADLELANEDRGWELLSALSVQEFSREGLRRAADNSRVYTIINPLIKRGAALRIAYVWGQGMSVAARSKGDQADQDVNAVVQGFIDDKSNLAAFTSGQAHEELERALYTDGNLFPALFTNPRTGRVQVRCFPFDQIADCVTNPEDSKEPWFYLRQWSTRAILPGYDGGTTTVNQTLRTYYPALGFRPRLRPRMIDGIPVRWDAPIRHVAVNRLDTWRWGIGDAYAALNWARMYKDFLTDWAKLVKSLSRFAWRLSADKSSKAQTAAAKLRAVAAVPPPLPAGTGQPADWGSAAGATSVSGPGAVLEAIPKTGATIDSGSGKPLAAMVASAIGLPITMLLADPGHTGARAVAETLDHPTELEMTMRQSLWTDVYTDILDYQIDQAVKAPMGLLKGTVTVDQDGRETVVLAGDQDRTLDIVWPDMTAIDPLQLIQAISTADATGKMPPKETMRLCLEALGVDDVDDLLAEFLDADGNFIPPDAAANASAGQAAVDAFRRGQDPAAAVA